MTYDRPGPTPEEIAEGAYMPTIEEIDAMAAVFQARQLERLAASTSKIERTFRDGRIGEILTPVPRTSKRPSI